MMLAPRSANISVVSGPGNSMEKSMMVNPDSGCHPLGGLSLIMGIPLTPVVHRFYPYRPTGDTQNAKQRRHNQRFHEGLG